MSLRYEASGLTSFAGLELIGRFLRALDFREQVRRVQSALPKSDFGSVPMVMLVLMMLITGARRVRHVDYLRGDALVARVCGLKQVATRHTVGRWLRSFDAAGVTSVLSVNERLVGDVITRSDLKRLTVDVDGSVLSTGLKVEGARRGYNPHQRKVPSYYPVTAYEANTGQVLRVQNRAGNVHDGKASVEFLKALYAQLDETLERRHRLEMRMVIYRKRVRHRSPKNYQLDLFDPNDGYYEYSAVATNKTVTGQTLWHFMCGRSTHEKVYGELKNGFAFDCIPTQSYEGNSAWQVLSILAFNLMRGLQARVTERRKSNRKRRALHVFETIQTLRYRFINRAGLLVQPNGRATLDVGDNRSVRERFQAIEQAIAG